MLWPFTQNILMSVTTSFINTSIVGWSQQHGYLWWTWQPTSSQNLLVHLPYMQYMSSLLVWCIYLNILTNLLHSMAILHIFPTLLVFPLGTDRGVLDCMSLLFTTLWLDHMTFSVQTGLTVGPRSLHHTLTCITCTCHSANTKGLVNNHSFTEYTMVCWDHGVPSNLNKNLW